MTYANIHTYKMHINQCHARYQTVTYGDIFLLQHVNLGPSQSKPTPTFLTPELTFVVP